MAKIRELKKNIDNLIYQVIADCFVYTDLHPDLNQEGLSAILSEAVGLRNDLISRVNNPGDRDDPKRLRSHFKTIEKDLYSGADKLFNRLSDLTRK